MLVVAAEANPEEFERAEATLLEAARTLAVRDLRRAVAYWRQTVDAARAESEAERRFGLRRLHVSPTLEGMVRVDGDLDPETGQVVLRALEGRATSPSELEDVGPITPETARRWACDASVARVITMGDSEPLDVGPRTPVVSPALRRALTVRDGGRRFPGCDRPHAWCDAHHIVRHSRGPTAHG